MQKIFKEIIHKLGEMPTEAFVGTYGNHELICCVIDSCCEIIERVGSKYETDWTPCSESMPEDVLTYNKNTSHPVIDVLVTTNGGKVTKLQRIGDKGYDGTDSLFWYWGRICGGVKAWQPLPEGYKGE